jgi:hypothetical protein
MSESESEVESSASCAVGSQLVLAMSFVEWERQRGGAGRSHAGRRLGVVGRYHVVTRGAQRWSLLS